MYNLQFKAIAISIGRIKPNAGNKIVPKPKPEKRLVLRLLMLLSDYEVFHFCPKVSSFLILKTYETNLNPINYTNEIICL